MSATVVAPRLRTRFRVPSYLRKGEGLVGLVIALIILAMALLGPFLSPHDAVATVASPGMPPSAGYLLGTDFLGRDVWSRLLSGGVTMLGYSFAATVLTYGVGIPAGLIAGYTRSWVDGAIMRSVDFMLALPGLLVLLLLVTGLGSNPWVTVVGVAFVLAPGVARIVRSATSEIAVRGYVESAVSRGETTPAIVRLEILPNIVTPIMADLGIRFAGIVILIASVNYLGLGLQPPTPDWGLMVSENRQVIYGNPIALLAPAFIIGLVTISVNLIADAFARSRGKTAGGR